MPTLVFNNVKKTIKYIGLFFIIIIGLYLVTVLLQFVFNLGGYFGTFMRCLYAFVEK